MPLSETATLRIDLVDIYDDVRIYFQLATHSCEKIPAIEDDSGFDFLPWSEKPDYFWDALDASEKSTANTLIERLLVQAAKVGRLAKTSPLAGEEDVLDVKEAAKSMRAALRLRRYNYKQVQVIHDEGRVLGVHPASQNTNGASSPSDAQKEYNRQHAKIIEVLALIDSGIALEPSALPFGSAPGSTKYRAGTAFIMMWMDPKQPDLADVADAVKEVFENFKIKALRVDDIEHEGLITTRILSEIQTSEFLFADLTGVRPNVYYEIGFAHALGKRVILFRKSGTGIHFDLAGYNCPDYDNLRDLKEKLTKRLVGLTNLNPSTNKAE